MDVLIIVSLKIIPLMKLKLSGYETTTNNSNIAVNRASTDAPPPVETELSSFSTTIYIKEAARQNNVTITCSKLNDTIVKSGETFSFCNTIGRATPEEGYQEADIFDSNGKIKKGYGGGNCQISSTLYNVVLNTSGLTVVERHEHSRKVDYVETGKDAAVAYGSVDFKFRNDNSYDIKIYASNTPDSVDIRIVKI